MLWINPLQNPDVYIWALILSNVLCLVVVCRQKWITMSESLNVSIIGRYEARIKNREVTFLFEASRQWEIWNLSNKAQRSLGETTCLNVNEPICIIVTFTPNLHTMADKYLTWPDGGSRMSWEVQVHFRERFWVKLPGLLTQLLRKRGF